MSPNDDSCSAKASAMHTPDVVSAISPLRILPAVVLTNHKTQGSRRPQGDPEKMSLNEARQNPDNRWMLHSWRHVACKHRQCAGARAAQSSRLEHP